MEKEKVIQIDRKMGGKDILILFGSQTGNSEDIAKDLHERCSKLAISSVCKNLNSVKKVDLKEIAKFIIVVCSTTGNGDTPENADAWWRSVKLRAAPKDTFADIPYAVMGLGDTNYDQFCHMGKIIDKRLMELGGNRFHPLCCADEATGLEETVERWKEEIMDLLCQLDELIAVAAAKAFNPHELVQSFETLAVVNQPSWIPSGLMDMSCLINWLNVPMLVQLNPESSQLPNAKNVLSNGPFVTVSASVSVTSVSTTISVDGWTAANPFLASIKSARWLTSTANINEDEVCWGETKRVLHLELDLSCSGIEYLPGDSIGICCPNPRSLIDAILLRLKDAHQELNLDLDTRVAITSNGIEECITLQEILSYKIDLVGIPRQAHVLAIAKFCTDKKEERELQWLCSKGATGKLLWGQFIEAQRVGLGELLTLFTSCRFTLSALLACAATMPPRFYSIASSPLMSKKSATIAFSCVRYTCGLSPSKFSVEKPKILKRRGLCTSYLERILKSRLDGANIAEEEKIRIFLKPSITFRLPGSISPPLILIGPGTGVAPFIGFLQHRAMITKEQKKEGEEITTGTWRGGFELECNDLPHECNNVGRFIHSNPAGPISLFFGCRDHNDYLYEDDLEKNVREGTLTSLHVAQSRVGPEKVYVTHKLLENGANIANSILHEGGYIYVCGDGNNMAKDVLNAIKQILHDHGSLSEEEAEEALDDMKLRRRYIVDIWS